MRLPAVGEDEVPLVILMQRCLDSCSCTSAVPTAFLTCHQTFKGRTASRPIRPLACLRFDAVLQTQHEAALKEEEEMLRLQLLARLAEADGLDNMKAQKRRLQVEQHKQEAGRLIAEKQALRRAAEV